MQDTNIALDITQCLGKQHMTVLCNDNNDPRSSISAFEWEIEARKALLEPIGITETVLRNAIDQSICAWWKDMGLPGTWTDAPLAPEAEFLSLFVHSSSWKKRAESNLKHRRRAVHSDLIAHTSFGTWKNMIGNPASYISHPPKEKERYDSWIAAQKRETECAKIWKKMLVSAFPNIPQGKSARGKLSPRAYIGARISRIAALRNRVCHWDSLIKVDIEMRYKDMREIVSAINPKAELWMNGLCRQEIDNAIKNKPTWL